ncbi:hypothetical protein DL96DRAFT_1016058 [Flagelloscypha sp. PMI_526]|nr:hypothetical protein DL96DRAFT_1016058 [Flagelloscypha sp. PMI_526]
MDSRRKQPQRPKSPKSLYLPTEIPSPPTSSPKPLLKLEAKKQKDRSEDGKSSCWKVRNPFYKIPGQTENVQPPPSETLAITPYPLPLLQPNVSPHPRALTKHSQHRLPPQPFLEAPGQEDSALSGQNRTDADLFRTDSASTQGESNRDTDSYLSSPPSYLRSPPSPRFIDSSRHEEPVLETRIGNLSTDSRSTWGGSRRATRPNFHSSSSHAPSSSLEPSHKPDRVPETHSDSPQTWTTSPWDESSTSGDTLTFNPSPSQILLPEPSPVPLRQTDLSRGTRHRVDSFQTDNSFAWDGDGPGSFSSRSSLGEMQGNSHPVQFHSTLGMGSPVSLHSDPSSCSASLRGGATNSRPKDVTLIQSQPPPFYSLKLTRDSMDHGETFGREYVGIRDDSQSRTGIPTEKGKAMDMDDIVSRLRSLS